jgi:hypothetical protein
MADLFPDIVAGKETGPVLLMPVNPAEMLEPDEEEKE